MAYSGNSYNRFVSVWPPCAAMVTSLIVHRVWTWHLPWCAWLVWLLKAQAKAKAHWLMQKMFFSHLNHCCSWFWQISGASYLFSPSVCGWPFSWGPWENQKLVKSVSQHIPNWYEVVFVLYSCISPPKFVLLPLSTRVSSVKCFS